MPTTAQIAARAGVSTTTVQNVLHGRGSHTPLTRQRVLDVAHQLGHGATRAVDDTWRLDAACRGAGPHLFHPDEDEDGHAVVTAAKRVCAGCPVADPCVCRDCGEPRRRVVDVDPSPRRARSTERMGSTAGNGHHGHLTRQATTVGWSTCGHSNYRPGIVLDPFSGAGTTLAVADIHGRDAIGIDLDPANRKLYEPRYEQCWRSLGRDGASPVTEHGEQLGLALEVVA